MPIPEAGRAAGHVLLDVASAWDADASDEQNFETANLAVERLLELDAVRVDVEIAESEDEADDEISVSVDVSDLIGPSALLLHRALELLAERGLDRADAIAQLREGVDSTD
ncbi:hypothetical protein [Amnibacterium setariae]|uniref:Uncharacterized protein n=1 Tax=Amnibacterium setariae TaxID=2306585 RepID=A0A3A1TWH7_9MICO|nr:hypothetical protein [Amnibacterium setariae]RIX28159.1 hypothetical protein D1781_11810 [Amnibacterium setariae]